ncbi:MAG TPA: lysophospholipid acyltransferase family protein [Ignavibacteriaceae bacterium]|nr:lysophospholipid acyltransferase family protein [Ignavibacteriaceae bacterium]
MSLKKSKQQVLRFLGDHFLYFGITALCKSLKIEKENYSVIENLNSKKQNYVLAFWHSTMILPWYLHGAPNFAALTSKSKDGDLLAKILKKWKYQVVRGSSSTGGDLALGIMVDYARNKYSIAITPDGPRGPRQKFKAGAVVTAKKTSIPVVLAGVGFKRKKTLNNWDKFEIPYFFTTAKVVYSETIYVDSNFTYEETSAVISKCDAELNKLQQKAQEFKLN